MGGPTLGRQIYLARKAAGLSRDDLGDMVGVSKTAVMKWEESSNSPSVENLIKLEEALGVRFYLSGGTNHESSGEGWKVPGTVTADMVEMAVMLSRLPRPQYEALWSLARMGVERADEVGVGGSVISSTTAEETPDGSPHDDSHAAKSRRKKGYSEEVVEQRKRASSG